FHAALVQHPDHCWIAYTPYKKTLVSLIQLHRTWPHLETIPSHIAEGRTFQTTLFSQLHTRNCRVQAVRHEQHIPLGIAAQAKIAFIGVNHTQYIQSLWVQLVERPTPYTIKHFCRSHIQ